MSDLAVVIYFRAGRGDLSTAAVALAARGLVVRRVIDGDGEGITAGRPDGPRLRVEFAQGPFMQVEAGEIGEGTKFAAELDLCEARYQIWSGTGADEDEFGTLAEIQHVLEEATDGFTYDTRRGQLTCLELESQR
jgi:hypothetical protein